MNPYFPTDGGYYPTTGLLPSSSSTGAGYNYSAGSYASTTSGYGDSARSNAFRDNLDRNTTLKNSRSGEHFYAEDSYNKATGYNYGGLDKLKSFTPTGMSGFDLKRPLFSQSGPLASDQPNRGRKNTFDSGSKYGNNMYASQMVMPSSGSSKLGGLGGLSGMGRAVAEEPLPSFDHNFGLEPPMTSYTPMADSLLKRNYLDTFKSFKPSEGPISSSETFKTRLDQQYKPSIPSFHDRPIGGEFYSKQPTHDFSLPSAIPELHHTASENYEQKKPAHFQQQSQHVAHPRLEFKAGQKEDGLRISPGFSQTTTGQNQQSLMFVGSDGSRPSNGSNFKKKFIFAKQDRANPQTMKLPAKDSSEDHRQSPITPPISKSEPTIAEPSDNSLSPTISKSRLSRQPCKNDFVIGKKLGKGKFGDVHLAKHKQLGFACAIKIIPKSMLKDEQLQNQIIRELKIQCFLHHFNIASMYGYFNDEESVYFLLELCCDGQLYNIIKERKRIPEIEAKYLILQICCAAEYLHRQRVIHRDLKLQNIIMHEGIAKMCDFGWAVYSEDEYRTTFCFSPVYRPPELIMNGKYDEKVDIWAIGILTYELLIGKIPFKINSEEDLVKICKQDIRFPEYVELSDQAKNFILSILKKDPKDRFDIEELMMHPFLKQAEAVNAFDIPAFL